MELGTQEQRTKGMKKRAQELIDQAYQRGFKAGKEERSEWEKEQRDRLVEEGRNEAWEAVRKIYLNKDCGGLTGDELISIFGMGTPSIINNYSASEAISKIRDYEERKQKEQDEIKVGDEIRVGKEGGNAFNVVVHLVGERCDGIKVYQCMGGSGIHFTFTSEDDVRKTGRHFPEIAEVLKKMQEDSAK